MPFPVFREDTYIKKIPTLYVGEFTVKASGHNVFTRKTSVREEEERKRLRFKALKVGSNLRSFELYGTVGFFVAKKRTRLTLF